MMHCGLLFFRRVREGLGGQPSGTAKVGRGLAASDDFAIVLRTDKGF
jgi:hypothetical protein